MCDTPSSGPSQTWTCSACTFASNPSITIVCTVCETPRTIASTLAASTSSFPSTSTIPSFPPTLTSTSSNTSTTSSTSHTSSLDSDTDSDIPLSQRLPSRLRKRLSSMSSTSSSTSSEHDVTDKALPMFSMDFLTICMLHKKLSAANEAANAPPTTSTSTSTSTSSSPPSTTKSGGLLSKVFGKKRGSTFSSSPPAPVTTPPTPININKGMKDVGTSSDRKQAMRVLNELYQHVEYKKENTKHRPIATCQICYCDFTGDATDASGDPDDDDVLRVKMTTCGHSMICADCMHQYCYKRIEEETVVPWLPCPAEECCAPVHPSDLHAAGLSTLELLSMARIVMSKKICRNQNWVSCPTPRCVYGFIQMGKPVEQTLQCSLCNQSHKIEKGKQVVDDEMKKMLDAGTLRKCPKCDQITLKEKGICNVIECAKCGIWWNWRTRETAKDSRSLKNMARSRGTLWEPGELRYQQQLEQNDPEAFKALLERNGMRYDPNYVRGT